MNRSQIEVDVRTSRDGSEYGDKASSVKANGCSGSSQRALNAFIQPVNVTIRGIKKTKCEMSTPFITERLSPWLTDVNRLQARVIIASYNQHVRLLSPEPWLVRTTKAYSGMGADIVMESLTLIDLDE